jgi:hypothetical protein
MLKYYALRNEDIWGRGSMNVKVKSLFLTNYAPCHEDVGNGDINVKVMRLH